MGRRRHRFTSFLGSDATTPPPSTSGAEYATNPSSSSYSSSSQPLLSASLQSKSWNAARPLANRLICPSPAGAGAAATAVVALPLNPSLDLDCDLLRRKNILFKSDLFGLRPSGGFGGSEQAPPFLPHRFIFFAFDLLFLICPMHDTLGDDGSGVRYPECPPRLLPFLLPRASGGTMETMGPEKALRWLNDDLPWDGKEENEAAVDLRNDASTPPVQLLDLACFCCFSINMQAHVPDR